MNIEKIEYSTFGECYKISNGTVELLVTADIGPRVISYRFVGGTNILAEIGKEVGADTDLGLWYLWGGHRLWHAPEAKPRSYSPDNSPVNIEIRNDTICATQDIEPGTGIEKQIEVALDAKGTGVTLTHKLTNKNLWPIELAPWCLTIMNGGGFTIIPQEPFKPHTEELLPARPMVLWHYANLADPRWTLGEKYILLQTDADIDTPQKLGVANKQEWAAYLREETLFVKRFPYVEGKKYVDYGCNFETFTKGNFMEIETVGALITLQPGESVNYVENWNLFDGVKAEKTDASIDANILPIVDGLS